ncbi:aspartic proteinase nepenthesin-1-like [Iris pallida]|uniref:Aspartic proteinase nepenthesin-1-like n=1 Tax=Iris pallida TaxID=29817 RepID=A0AAX6GM87_IRIPA|nr:aspartic proteinase nepenthesin-1-like [Iris pallida]
MRIPIRPTAPERDARDRDGPEREGLTSEKPLGVGLVRVAVGVVAVRAVAVAVVARKRLAEGGRALQLGESVRFRRVVDVVGLGEAVLAGSALRPDEVAARVGNDG